MVNVLILLLTKLILVSLLSEVINFLRKTNADQAIIDKLIQALHEQNPEVKGDPKQVFVSYTPQVKKRTSSISVGVLVDVYLLENGTDEYLLENGTDKFLLELV